MEEHDCKDYRVYIKPCDDCIENGYSCPLSEYGVCSICGEVVIE